MVNGSCLLDPLDWDRAFASLAKGPSRLITPSVRIFDMADPIIHNNVDAPNA